MKERPILFSVITGQPSQRGQRIALRKLQFRKTYELWNLPT